MANEERFRRIGDYTADRLLKDLQSLEDEIKRLRVQVTDIELAKGDQGLPGTPGLPGTDGQPGEKGDQGPTGFGYNAYQLDVIVNGFAGTLQQWLASLRSNRRVADEDRLYISVDRGSIDDPAVESIDYGSII